MRAATRAVLSRAVARVRHPMYLPLANGFAHCRAVTCVRHTPTVSPAAGKPDWQEGSYAPRAGYPRLGPSYAARRCRTRPTAAAALTGSPAAPAGRLYLCSLRRGGSGVEDGADVVLDERGELAAGDRAGGLPAGAVSRNGHLVGELLQSTDEVVD